MPKNFKQISKKIGQPPGTIQFVGERKVEEVLVTLMEYDEKNFEFKTLEKLDGTLPDKEKPGVSWINVYGLHDSEILNKIDSHFGIHHLVLEDVVNTNQRPKLEFFDDHAFVVLKMIWFDEEALDLNAEQISIILGKTFVICFQERKGDLFNSIRERIRNNQGRIRKSGPDYLTFRLMDVVVDHYFLVLEKIGDLIEDLEEEVLDKPDSETIQKINHHKRNLILLRKYVWPLREVISGIEREEVSFFKKKTMPFVRNLYDHTIQVIDTIESYRDLVSGLLEIHMSSVSNKMNEVMKVLTIVATIFIPLTFLAGIYGMNFEFMPELKWRWGYPIVWLMMVGIFLGMLLFFRRKKWM